MNGAEVIHGELVQYEQPDWGPLLRLVGHWGAGWFMWMHEVELHGGTRVHAYKHIDTRRYLHLDASGRAFDFQPVDTYLEIATATAVGRAFKFAAEARLTPPGSERSSRR